MRFLNRFRNKTDDDDLEAEGAGKKTSILALLPKPSDISVETRDLFVFFLFMFSFSITLFVNRPGETAFYLNFNLRDLYEMNEMEFSHYPFVKNFHNIWEHGFVWNWVFDVVLPGTFDSGLPSSQFDGSASLLILGQNHLLGGIRFRQVRGQTKDCGSQPPGLVNLTTCYKPISAGQYVEDWGPNNQWKHSSTFAHPFEYWGELASYGGSGYIVDVPADYDKATEALEYILISPVLPSSPLFQPRCLRTSSSALFSRSVCN
jgi:hypothetical protein